MLAPSEQANVKKTPTTAYIISVYKVERESGSQEIREIKAKMKTFRCTRATTARDSKEIGFIGLVRGR